MDSVPSSTQDVAILLLTYLLSTFFAVVKIVLLSLDRSSLPPDRERLRYYASKIEDLQENRQLFDGIVTFGRTLTTLAFGVYGYVALSHLFPDTPAAIRVVVAILASALILGLFAYSIPRAVAKRYYEAFAPLTYLTYSVASWLLIPFVALMIGAHNLLLRLVHYDEKLAFLSAEDQSRMHDKENGEEGLDREERAMIRGIFELGETTVEEIMTPRIDIKALEEDTDLQEVLRVVREEGHSRLPVYRESIDSVVGVLYVKDVLAWMAEHRPDSWDLKSLTKKPYFVPGGKMVDDLMADFKTKHLHMAVVVDEYGGTAGVVTMEDILEEIVGDIQDEYDKEERMVVPVTENVFHVDPHIDLHDLGEELDVEFDLDDVEYNTLGGLIYHEFGDVPQIDTVVEYDGLRFRVLEMERQRIQKVEVTIPRREQNGGGD